MRVAMIGTTLGHYRIERALGSGGMGDVYLAEDLVQPAASDGRIDVVRSWAAGLPH